MKSYIITLVLAVFGFVAQAQETFHKSFGEQGDEGALGICEDEDKNVYLIGSTKSFGSREIYLVKTDSMGNMLWTRSMGGSGIDKGDKIRYTKDGGLIVAGITTSAGAGRKDASLVKLDLEGNIKWAKSFGGERDDYFFDVKATLDGGFICVGETNSFNARGGDIFVV